MSRPPLVEPTEHGLYCRAGDFHIDPWRPVARAVVTHAHADHARPGSQRYLTAADGTGVLATRLGPDAAVEGLAYGDQIRLGPVRVSLHPAGHCLGSAQVRLEHAGETWVVSGDYRTDADVTCAAFTPVPCDVFLTESTFGLPVFRWPDPARVIADLDAWWRANADAGVTSIVGAYALGKAQRVLAAADASIGPIFVHGAVGRLADAYAAGGVALPPRVRPEPEAVRGAAGRGLVVAPPSALDTPWVRRFGRSATAFVSGWMHVRGMRRRRNVDRGFVLSDHADWPGLLGAIDATGADRVIVTHGFADTLARHLREHGRDSAVYPTRSLGDDDERGAAVPADGAEVA